MKLSDWDTQTKRRLQELRSKFRLNYGKNCTAEECEELMLLHQKEKNYFQKRFGSLLIWLIDVLYQNDPANLSFADISQNEYDIEAKIILEELTSRKCQTLKEIIELVYDVFLEQFGEDQIGLIDSQCFENISKQIFSKKHEWLPLS